MKEKNNISVLLGAAFLMATSAIGPGFMMQTAQFTQDLKASFAFVIVVRRKCVGQRESCRRCL